MCYFFETTENPCLYCTMPLFSSWMKLTYRRHFPILAICANVWLLLATLTCKVYTNRIYSFKSQYRLQSCSLHGSLSDSVCGWRMFCLPTSFLLRSSAVSFSLLISSLTFSSRAAFSAPLDFASFSLAPFRQWELFNTLKTFIYVSANAQQFTDSDGTVQLLLWMLFLVSTHGTCPLCLLWWQTLSFICVSVTIHVTAHDDDNAPCSQLMKKSTCSYS